MYNIEDQISKNAIQLIFNLLNFMESAEKSMIFTSRTVMGRDQTYKVQQLLQTLMNSSDSLVFREPVDWQGLNLMDYPLIIKKPMDLSTVKRKLNTYNYENVEDSLEDINQIWQNAKIYNPKQNEIHKLADKLEKQTKKMIKNYLPFVGIDNNQAKKKALTKKELKNSKQNEQPKPKTYLEKQEEAKNQELQNQEPEEPEHVTIRKNLLYLIQLCKKEQIGVLFQMIHKNCPEAIDFDEEGQAVVRGQKLDDNIVKRLNNLMQMWGIGYKVIAPTKKK